MGEKTSARALQILPAFRAGNLQVIMHTEHDIAHRWVEALGAERESLMRSCQQEQAIAAKMTIATTQSVKNTNAEILGPMRS